MDAPTGNAAWRSSHWLLAAELLAVALIFLADYKGLVPLSKTPFLLLLGWASLRVRKLRWMGVGLKIPERWPRTLLLGISAGLLIEAFELFVSQPALVSLTGQPPDLHDFDALRGNLKFALLALLLVWTLAAFGEEMFWRGYLLNRIADLRKGTQWAWGLSLVAVSAAFGLAHSYQGITGIIDEGLMGVLLGVVYLASGRNLFAPIVAHGVQDSVDVLLIFLDKYPGT